MALPFLILSAASREAAFATNTGGYRPGGAHRPFAAALSLAIAGGIGATLMLALVIPKAIDEIVDEPWTTITVPAAKPDPIDDTPVVDQQPRDRTVTMVDRRVDLRTDSSNDFTFETGPLDFGDVTVDPGLGNGGGVVRPVDPPPAPVFRAATRDPRFSRSFQPSYPPALERQEIEGRCPVSVTVAASGRVSAVRDLGCAHALFFSSTQRQAMANWRFRPATRDGAPIESTETLTVTFRIDSDD